MSPLLVFELLAAYEARRNHRSSVSSYLCFQVFSHFQRNKYQRQTLQSYELIVMIFKLTVKKTIICALLLSPLFVATSLGMTRIICDCSLSHNAQPTILEKEHQSTGEFKTKLCRSILFWISLAGFVDRDFSFTVVNSLSFGPVVVFHSQYNIVPQSKAHSETVLHRTWYKSLQHSTEERSTPRHL